MNAAPMRNGEVNKVDMEAQTVTLNHGPTKNLGMPGMTMAFQVKIPDLLTKVNPGDKVKFIAKMPGGTLAIAAIELAK